MARVPTVRGEVDSSELGVTLVHEHLCFGAPDRWRQKAMDYQVALCRRAVEVGVNTIVDVSPVPDVARILALSERVPELNLVLATGAYLETAEWTRPVRDLSEDQMCERMVKDMTEGYDGFEGTGVRAGVIKVASNLSQVTEWEKKNFRAAARAQRQAPAPICFHSCSGCREQMEYAREHGANVSATFYVARAGGYLQFNNFDFEFDTPLEDMLYLISRLEERGYGDRLLISIDANWSFDEDGSIWHEAEKHHAETGKRTYAYAITHAVPMLMSGGVSLQRINRYLVENPRRLFGAAG
jgi:phosphotriesterase-related protein